MEYIYIDEDNVFQWDAMVDGTDGTYVNDATVTFAVKDLADVSKGTVSSNLTFSVLLLKI